MSAKLTPRSPHPPPGASSVQIPASCVLMGCGGSGWQQLLKDSKFHVSLSGHLFSHVCNVQDDFFLTIIENLQHVWHIDKCLTCDLVTPLPQSYNIGAFN